MIKYPAWGGMTCRGNGVTDTKTKKKERKSMTESNNMEWKYDEICVDISDIENKTNYVSYNEEGSYDIEFLKQISDEVGIRFEFYVHSNSSFKSKYHTCCNSQVTKGNRYITRKEAESIGSYIYNEKILVCPVCHKIAKSNYSPEVKNKLRQYRTNISSIELANRRVENRAKRKEAENDRNAEILDSICRIKNAKNVDEAKSVFLDDLFDGGMYGQLYYLKDKKLEMMASALLHKMGRNESGQLVDEDENDDHWEYEYLDFMEKHAPLSIDKLTENAVIYRITGDKEGHFRQVSLDLFGVDRQTVYGMLKNSLGNDIIEIHGHEDVSGGEE
tara:strand:- start:1394 stop:2386 length:993 start_codon:yes stop_codon:yes gene_type:complete